MRPSEIALVLTAMLALPASPSAEEGLCRDLDAFAIELHAEGKVPLFVARHSSGVLTELHMSRNGAWTILEIFSDGLACKFAEGDALEFVRPVIVLNPEHGS